ncbi:DUF2062 domain-containing protein [Geoalkalibacter halelectricus]|nr:DUF2062 domain-containing protein [Geoalkalibacter halelectricus]
MSPRALAATLALGTLIGTLPVVWGTSLLCALTAAGLRLNQLAMQAVNYLVWPLQIALFIPFFKAGRGLVPNSPVELDSAMLAEQMRAAPLQAVASLGEANLLALLGWLCWAPLGSVLLYGLLRLGLWRLEGSRRARQRSRA